MSLFDETELAAFIDLHYARPGDQLFRMERLPEYDGPPRRRSELLIARRSRAAGSAPTDTAGLSREMATRAAHPQIEQP